MPDGFVLLERLYESPGGNQVDGLPPAQHASQKFQEFGQKNEDFSNTVLFQPAVNRQPGFRRGELVEQDVAP